MERKSKRSKKKESRFKERVFEKTAQDFIREEIIGNDEDEISENPTTKQKWQNEIDNDETAIYEVDEENHKSGDETKNAEQLGQDPDKKKGKKQKKKKKLRKGDLKRMQKEKELLEQKKLEEDAAKVAEILEGNNTGEITENKPEEVTETETEDGIKKLKIERKLDREANKELHSDDLFAVIVDKERVMLSKKDLDRLKQVRAEREQDRIDREYEEKKAEQIKEEQSSALKELQAKLIEKQKRKNKKKGKKRR